MSTRYLLGDRVKEEHCTMCTLWWEKSVTLGGTGVGQWDWSVKSQEELGEMRWERQRGRGTCGALSVL